MNGLSDQDWELINAYHDGELGDAEARDLECRIAAEPALARALTEVARASSSLAQLRPGTVITASAAQGEATSKNWRSRGWLTGGAAAAAIVAAVLLGPGIFAKPTALDIHAEFAEQTFSLSKNDLRAVSADHYESIPDLASASLTPVATQSSDAGRVIHYAGRNGCRLSYFRGGFGIHDTARLSDHQVEAWTTTGNLHHMIVATGMDQSKFDAIAAYLKQATRQETTERIMAAVSDATLAATPCVG